MKRNCKDQLIKKIAGLVAMLVLISVNPVVASTVPGQLRSLGTPDWVQNGSYRTPSARRSNVSEGDPQRMANSVRQEFNERLKYFDTFRDSRETYNQYSQDVEKKLPLLYSGNANCGGETSIRRPMNINDNGYLIDRDCDIIYVKPPVFGTKRTAGMLPTTRLNLCKSINADHRSIAVSAEQREAYGKLIRELTTEKLELGTSPSRIEEIDQQIRRYEEAIDYLNVYEDKVVQSLSDKEKDVGLIAQFTMHLEWSKLVEDYERINPNYKVFALPLKSADVSANITNKSLTSQVIGTRQLKAVNDITIKGTPVSVDLEAKLSPASSKEGNMLFNGSLAALVEYNNLGACAMMDKNINVPGKNYSAVLSTNLTYFYPAHLGYGYRIKFDTDELVKILTGKLTQKGTINSEEVVSYLTEAEVDETLKITFYTLEGQEVSPQDITNLKNEVKLSIAHQLLNQFGDVTVESLPDPKPPEPTKYKETIVIPGNCLTINTNGLLAVIFGLNGSDPVRARYGLLADIGKVLFGSSQTSCTQDRIITRLSNVTETGLKQFFKSVATNYSSDIHVNRTIIRAGAVEFVEDLHQAHIDRSIEELKNIEMIVTYKRQEYQHAILSIRKEIDNSKDSDQIQVKKKEIEVLNKNIEEADVAIKKITGEIQKLLTLFSVMEKNKEI